MTTPVGYTGYFDDSGSRDTKTVIMAGFIAPSPQWTKFNEEWNWVLDHSDYGLPADSVFHMRDFVVSRRAFSVFDGHLMDAEKKGKRDSLMGRLIAFTKIRATMSFSMSFRLADYEEANSLYQLKESLGGPWSFAGRACAGKARQWAQNRRTPLSVSEIEFVFEDGMDGKGELIEVMVRDGFLSPSFRPKGREWPPLQAADLFAWEFHKVMKQAFDGDIKHFRGSFQALMEMPGDNGVFPSLEDFLTKCVIPLGIPKREKSNDALI